MFILQCEKHRKEAKAWLDQDRINYPDSTDRERFGRHLTAVACEAVEDSCSDCKIISYIRM